MKQKTEKQQSKSMKAKSGSLIKTLARQTMGAGSGELQIANFTPEGGATTTDLTDIIRTKRKYYKQLYHTNSTTQMRCLNSLKSINYQKSPQIKMLVPREYVSQEALQTLFRTIACSHELFLQPQDDILSPELQLPPKLSP